MLSLAKKESPPYFTSTSAAEAEVPNLLNLEIRTRLTKTKLGKDRLRLDGRKKVRMGIGDDNLQILCIEIVRLSVVELGFSSAFMIHLSHYLLVC